MDFEVSELRDKLFSEYFKDSNGIRLEDLMKSLKPVTEIYQNLYTILEENLEDFDKHSSILKIKAVGSKGKHFLVIKESVLTYLIIDLDTNEVLDKQSTFRFFSEKFFIEKFGEVKSKSKELFRKMFNALNYKGNIKELIDFYIENSELLNIPSSIVYRVKFDDAYSFLSIHLSDGGNVLAFRTKDQRLYEHLFFGNDLEPLSLQDASQKIGYAKMQEVFSKFKDIRVPISVIPESLQQFLRLNENLDESRK